MKVIDLYGWGWHGVGNHCYTTFLWAGLNKAIWARAWWSTFFYMRKGDDTSSYLKDFLPRLLQKQYSGIEESCGKGRRIELVTCEFSNFTHQPRYPKRRPYSKLPTLKKKCSLSSSADPVQKAVHKRVPTVGRLTSKVEGFIKVSVVFIDCRGTKRK